MLKANWKYYERSVRKTEGMIREIFLIFSTYLNNRIILF